VAVPGFVQFTLAIVAGSVRMIGVQDVNSGKPIMITTEKESVFRFVANTQADMRVWRYLD